MILRISTLWFGIWFCPVMAFAEVWVPRPERRECVRAQNVDHAMIIFGVAASAPVIVSRAEGKDGPLWRVEVQPTDMPKFIRLLRAHGGRPQSLTIASTRSECIETSRGLWAVVGSIQTETEGRARRTPVGPSEPLRGGASISPDEQRVTTRSPAANHTTLAASAHPGYRLRRGGESDAQRSARLGDFPRYDVEAFCGRLQGLALAHCRQTEQRAFDFLRLAWSRVSLDSRAWCLAPSNRTAWLYTAISSCVRSFSQMDGLVSQGPFRGD